MNLLEIQDLRVSVEGKEILKGINLKVKKGEVHAIMGPNGGGKSTLSYTLMGHPRYKVDSGGIKLEGKEMIHLKPEERAKAGVFLAFQYPMEIPGVSVGSFLRTAYTSLKGADISIPDFLKILREKMKDLSIKEEFLTRYLNEGFSGGEKKRMEILQLSVFQPKLAVLDETDSGLDIDSLRVVSEGIKKSTTPEMGVILITHYQRILKYLKPDFVHVLLGGKIIRSGGAELAVELEEKGYGSIKNVKTQSSNVRSKS